MEKVSQKTSIKRYTGLILLAVISLSFTTHVHGQAVAEGFVATPPDDGNLNIIVFGAHPDDAQLGAGGTGAMWADMGHHVNYVSATNGDIGHAQISGGELAKIRIKEHHEANRILGASGSEVYDIHDGEIMPTLENRIRFVRSIRNWNADIVIGHRPSDYHPDHRYTGILMRDAAFMVTVKNFLPSVPHLTSNPVFLYSYDRFTSPQPFAPDVVVSIDPVIDQKMEALFAFESQIESFWSTGGFEEVMPLPDDPEKRLQQKEEATQFFRERFRTIANTYRDQLIEIYGEEKGSQIEYAEAFQLGEYGRQPTKEELMSVFPVRY